MNSARRSPLLTLYDGARMPAGRWSDMLIAHGGPAIAPGQNALVDISAVGKRLVVGSGAASWLEQRGDDVPSTLFECREQTDTGVVVRVHEAQYLRIGPLADAPTDAPRAGARTLVLPYENAEFAVLGDVREALLRELGSLDPATLESGRWYATRIAHAEVGLRVVVSPQPHWRLVCTPADAIYLFGALRDVLKEHHGVVTTIDAYAAYAGGA